MVCGWSGCCSIRTAVISPPSKVTSTCTGPFSVFTVEPATTREVEFPELEEEGVEAGWVASVVVVAWDGA
ncbi:hypothetical protein SSP24_14380 [Streptomyces spinoverrucosus]|uniref:Uncharacterized protein n=1 Tax=Streptomyces spinoverrucosus TaxID=284043 RepID=A0A4Y3VBP2_9ACTN|nr:hypothetical protein SSP24_14380 [Streptomyces spinoverrucosus]